MKLLALLVGIALAADQPGFFIMRDSLEHCKKLAKLTPSGEHSAFIGEKSYFAKTTPGEMADKIQLNFIDGKLAKIVWTFNKTGSSAAQWKVMIDLRRQQHASLAPCVAEGRDCFEWDEPEAAERLTFDPEGPEVISTLIDKAAYQRAAKAKKEQPSGQ